MTTWSDIARRAEEAEGADSALDRMVFAAMGYGSDPGWTERWSSSLDACLDLMKEVLPGWAWVTGCSELEGKGVFHASVWTDKRCKRAYAATPPLALLAAIAHAMDAIGKKEAAHAR